MGDDTRQDLDRRRAAFLSPGDYDRVRPGYPTEAIRWMVGDEPKDIVDLGCGPGKLTASLAELGHWVVGIDPSMAMLAGMRGRDLPAICGRAEAIPLQDASRDAVTAATAFHWFDAERAVPEMRRVLRAGGTVGLITNIRDENVPWIKALSEIIGSESAMGATLGGAEGMPAEFKAKLEGGGHFTDMEHATFAYEQELSEEQLVALVESRSYIAILPPDEKNEVLMRVRDLCRTHPELGGETFSMPYTTHAFRVQVA
jgi:ubiquinone/menaquinone biosynthesis C-methylase UbiE